MLSSGNYDVPRSVVNALGELSNVVTDQLAESDPYATRTYLIDLESVGAEDVEALLVAACAGRGVIR